MFWSTSLCATDFSKEDGMKLSKRALAEFIGTFWLVFGGCGSAIFSAAFPQLGIGFYGVAFAFGLTVLTMAYAIGHISGRSEEHTSELQSQFHLVCRLLL